jgi:hypothetical protein
MAVLVVKQTFYHSIQRPSPATASAIVRADATIFGTRYCKVQRTEHRHAAALQRHAGVLLSPKNTGLVALVAGGCSSLEAALQNFSTSGLRITRIQDDLSCFNDLVPLAAPLLVPAAHRR